MARARRSDTETATISTFINGSAWVCVFYPSSLSKMWSMYCEIAGPTIGGTHSLFFAANISGVDIIIHSQGWIESGKRFSFIITLPSRTEFHRLGDWLQKKTKQKRWSQSRRADAIDISSLFKFNYKATWTKKTQKSAASGRVTPATLPTEQNSEITDRVVARTHLVWVTARTEKRGNSYAKTQQDHQFQIHP